MEVRSQRLEVRRRKERVEVGCESQSKGTISISSFVAPFFSNFPHQTSHIHFANSFLFSQKLFPHFLQNFSCRLDFPD